MREADLPNHRFPVVLEREKASMPVRKNSIVASRRTCARSSHSLNGRLPMTWARRLVAAAALALPASAWGQVASHQVVALSGQAVPGTPAGVTYSTFSFPGLNDTGGVVFVSSLAGSGVNLGNDTALFGGPAASPIVVAREGDPAPGTPSGVMYRTLGSPVLNNTGQVAFVCSIRGPGVTVANFEASYAGPLAYPVLLARGGDPAPGTPAGTTYEIPFYPDL